jgi:hypothetical protein
MEGKAEAGDDFGAALATGDLDGDGFADLAIGVPTEDLEPTADTGAVSVIYGSANGLASAGNQLWDQNSSGVADTAEAGDAFGTSVAIGDFDGDGFGDLAIGVESEDIGSASGAGAMNVLYGSAAGLRSSGNQFWSQNSSGIPDSAESLDLFGVSVDAGDFDGDGFGDVAVGVFRENLSSGSTSYTDAGGVNVIYGGAGGLGSSGSQFWSQNSSGIQGNLGSYDVFGWSVFVADFGKGTEADLAVGAVLDNANGVLDSGQVNVIYGAPSGLSSDGNQLWNQDTTDVQDQCEIGDEFGYALG